MPNLTSLAFWRKRMTSRNGHASDRRFRVKAWLQTDSPRRFNEATKIFGGALLSSSFDSSRQRTTGASNRQRFRAGRRRERFDRRFRAAGHGDAAERPPISRRVNDHGRAGAIRSERRASGDL